MLEEVYDEMQEEGELTNDKLKRLRRENQGKDVRQKETLDLLLLKRPIMLLFILCVGFLHSFGAWLRGFHDLLKTRLSSLFMFLAFSRPSVWICLQHHSSPIGSQQHSQPPWNTGNNLQIPEDVSRSQSYGSILSTQHTNPLPKFNFVDVLQTFTTLI